MFQHRAAVLFDLDGTLVDASKDIAQALNQTLEEDGLASLSLPEVIERIGGGAGELISLAYEARTVRQPGDALARFKTHYDACCLNASHPYPGILGLLEGLRGQGRRLAVVTNKPTHFSLRILDGLGLGDFFEEVLGPERAPERKPSPLHVQAALTLLGCRAEEAVMVGDGTTDLLSGNAAGTGTVAALWGFRSRAQLAEAEPDAHAEDVAALGRLLLPSS